MGACPESQRWTESPEEVLRSLREQTRRWRQQELLRPCLSSGSTALDAWLGGGWPLGKVAELVGRHCAGRTTAAVATVAAATARGEVVAWIDAADALDPASLAAAGVDLERVLWVRPATPEQAVRAAELVLEAGGFTVVVVDLVPGRPARHEAEGNRQEEAGERMGWGSGGGQGVDGLVEGLGSGVRGPGPALDSRLSTLGSRRGGRGALALRLARVVERARVVALVLAERPWAGGLAGVTVHLQRGAARWLGGARNGPRWLAGMALVPGRPAGHEARGNRQEEAGERGQEVVVGGRWSVNGGSTRPCFFLPPITDHRSPVG
ncbi:MAG: hypothetical protein AB2L07_01340 [Thermoanaerobaculaceae bacterium]